MFKAIAFGLAFGAGFQAWRNYPPDQAPTAASMALVFAAGLVCAYGAGRGIRARRGPVATAVASAVAASRSTSTAESSSTAAVQVVLGDLIAEHKARQEPGGVAVPDVESIEWMRHRQVLAHEDIDGMDLSELVESSDTEPVER